jgi:hydroxymethylpyrimidine pyrophosphatase-like HAD family hydrolase
VHWLDKGTEHPHRIALSVHCDEVDRVIDSIRTDVESHGMRAQYVVSGMGEYLYLDVLSIRAGKRNAMDYVRKMFSISKERVVAAGDSGNDVLMLEGASCLSNFV